MVDPLTAGLGLGVDFITGIVGAIVGSSEERKSREQSERQFNQAFGEQVRQNRFGESMSKENLKLSKKGMALQEGQIEEGKKATNFALTKDMITRAENLLNTNEALRNNVLQTWAMAG